MATLPDDSEAKNAGIAVGHAAALELVAQRTGDGVVGAVTYENGNGPGGGLSGSTYVYGSEPGAYQKTPPAFLLAQTPWLATMTPFTMKSSSQFLPDEGPMPLDSEQWADDYNRTKRWGSLTDSPRTAEQTTIGLFWPANPGLAYTSMLGNLVQTYSLKALDSARLYAMTWSSAADAFIGCMNAKYHYNFWRPVTAIRAGGRILIPKRLAIPVGRLSPLPPIIPNIPQPMGASQAR